MFILLLLYYDYDRFKIHTKSVLKISINKICSLFAYFLTAFRLVFIILHEMISEQNNEVANTIVALVSN